MNLRLFSGYFRQGKSQFTVSVFMEVFVLMCNLFFSLSFMVI